jgi:plasmid stability protein
MPTHTLQSIPEELLQRLRMRAERNRRSLNAEMLDVLDVATRLPPVDVELLLDRARAGRGDG